MSYPNWVALSFLLISTIESASAEEFRAFVAAEKEKGTALEELKVQVQEGHVAMPAGYFPSVSTLSRSLASYWNNSEVS